VVTLTIEELSALLPANREACGWPVSYLDCAGTCNAYEKWPEEEQAAVQAIFEQMAIDWLWSATGGFFGVCEVEVRPCRQDCAESQSWGSTFWGRGPGYDPGFPRQGAGAGGSSFYPVLVSGQWFNITCGCLGGCQCTPSGPASLALPGPVQSITEVMIDGVTLDPASYRVERQRWLIRTDGQTWPSCQDMNVAPDAVGAFTIRYERGVPVPTGGIVAAGRLACELALEACGDQNCALPAGWSQINRQGLSITADDSEDARGETGIRSIDDWVWRITRPRPVPSVRSVDLPNLR